MSLLQQLNQKQSTYQAYENDTNACTWCGYCGNYGIQKSMMNALTLEGITNDQVLLCYDVGCNGNGSDKINAYTIHGLHGRVLSLAAGAQLANRSIPVIASAGDGATLSEGINHLIHAVRNDYPYLFLFHNNENYGLTTGQSSSTTRIGQKMNASPDGVTSEPLNPAQLILSLHPTFVGRSFSGNPEHMTKMIRKGLNHRGFAFLEIYQTCPTYNHATPQEWFSSRLYEVEKDPNYDSTDIWQARRAADDLEEKIAIGLLYQKDKPNFYEEQISRQGVNTELVNEVKPYDVSSFMQALV